MSQEKYRYGRSSGHHFGCRDRWQRQAADGMPAGGLTDISRLLRRTSVNGVSTVAPDSGPRCVLQYVAPQVSQPKTKSIDN
jgi:hypothetical protein